MTQDAHQNVRDKGRGENELPPKMPRRHAVVEPGRRVVKRSVELESGDFARIAFTMPTDLLSRIDEAAKLYGITRSTLIQNACKVYVEEDLIGTDWLRHLLQHKEIKKGSPTGYDVNALIDELSYYYVPELNES